MNNLLRIGITACAKFNHYESWVKSSGQAEIVRLDEERNNASEAASCDAVILSGGQDVHPDLYGRPEQIDCFGLTDFQPARDRFEYEVIRATLEARRPLLGICRSLQVMNVFCGGTLVPDIPAVMKNTAHGKVAGIDQVHDIELTCPSILFDITGTTTGKVNSAHHQAASRTGRGLRVTAVADGGVTEALEWAEPQDKSWLLLIQWHPERMTDLKSPFSAGILHSLLAVCASGSYAQP